MSARMLEGGDNFVHKPRDDLESLVHVLHYTVCLHFRLMFLLPFSNEVKNVGIIY